MTTGKKQVRQQDTNPPYGLHSWEATVP